MCMGYRSRFKQYKSDKKIYNRKWRKKNYIAIEGTAMEKLYNKVKTDFGYIKNSRTSFFLDSMEQVYNKLIFNGRMDISCCEFNNGYNTCSFRLDVRGIEEYSVIKEDDFYATHKLNLDSSLSEKYDDEGRYKNIIFCTYDWTYIIKCMDYEIYFYDFCRDEKSIVLIIGNKYEEYKKISVGGSTSIYDIDKTGKRYVVKYGKQFVTVNLVDRTDEIKELLSDIPYDNPTIVLLYYSSDKALRNMICNNEIFKEGYVINGLGMVMKINEFIV